MSDQPASLADAERRLETAEQSLAKVRQEAASTLQRLQRAAGDASLIRTLTQEYEALQAMQLTLKEERAQLEEAVQALQAKVVQAAAAAAPVDESVVRKLLSENAALRREIEDCRMVAEQVHALKKQLRSSQCEMEELGSEQQALIRTLRESEERQQDLREHVRELELALREEREVRAALEAKCAVIARESYRPAASAAGAAEQELGFLRSAMKKQEEILAQSEEQRNGLKAQLEKVTLERESLMQKLESVCADMARMEARTHESQGLANQLSKAKAMNSELEIQLSMLSSKIVQMQEELQVQHVRAAGASDGDRIKCAQLEAKCSELEDLVAELRKRSEHEKPDGSLHQQHLECQLQESTAALAFEQSKSARLSRTVADLEHHVQSLLEEKAGLFGRLAAEAERPAGSDGHAEEELRSLIEDLRREDRHNKKTIASLKAELTELKGRL